MLLKNGALDEYDTYLNIRYSGLSLPKWQSTEVIWEISQTVKQRCVRPGKKRFSVRVTALASKKRGHLRKHVAAAINNLSFDSLTMSEVKRKWPDLKVTLPNGRYAYTDRSYQRLVGAQWLWASFPQMSKLLQLSVKFLDIMGYLACMSSFRIVERTRFMSSWMLSILYFCILIINFRP